MATIAAAPAEMPEEKFPSFLQALPPLLALTLAVTVAFTALGIFSTVQEGAKAELKKLVPEDAKEALGRGLRAKRSKSGAISFDLVDAEVASAPVQ